MMNKIPLVSFFLFLYLSVMGQTVSVFPQDSPWKYRYTLSDLGTNWRSAAYDDTAWNVGNGEFGYGDGDELTLLTPPANHQEHRTTYFRKTFTLTNRSAYPWYRLNLLRDDGAVVYLNGREVARSNMSNDNLAYAIPAATETKNGDEATFYGFYISSALFVEGQNVLAIEIHQALSGEIDLSFNARLDAVLNPSCLPPANLNANAITTTSAMLSWNAVSTANNYNIRYRPTATGIWTNATTTTTQLNIAGLTPATNYEFQIQSSCSALSEYSALYYFTTLTAYCATPNALVASNVTAATATLSWNAVEGAAGYTIQYRRTGTATWTITTATTNTKSITGLLETRQYEFQVQASCLVNSAYSASASFTTLASGTSFIIPAYSSWKYLDNGTNQGTAWRSIAFNDNAWASGNTKLGYGEGDENTIVSYGPNANSKYITTYFRKAFQISNKAAYTAMLLEVVRDDGVVAYLNGTEIFRNNMPSGTINYNTLATVSVGGADESTWYSVAVNPNTLITGTNVLAVEMHQQSVASSDLSFNARLSATIPATCGIPDALTVDSIQATAVILGWQAVIGATSYNIQYRLIATEPWTTITSSTASKSLSGLSPESNYEFKVQAVCSTTSEFSAIANFATVSLSCNIPALLDANSITGTSAKLLWQAVPDATSYDIRYRQIDTEEWNTDTSNVNFKIIQGLSPQTAYEFKVQAVCSFASGYSGTYNFITTAPTCSTPTALSVISNNASTVFVSWNPVADAATYNVQYQLAGTNSWINTSSSAASKTITGLIPSTNYEFRVQAVCSINSGFSAVVGFTTYAGGTDTFLGANGTWKYLDNGSNQGTAWRSSTFDDSAWSSGTAELGYGDGDENTVVSYGPSPTAKYLTTYFRKSFTVINPAAYTEMTLGVVYDDGVVVYLNGNEVYRRNMPTGTITYTTPASSTINGAAESAWNTIALSSSLFLTGTNVLTAEVHQISYDSSDLSFNARIVAPSSEVIPVVTRGAYLQKLTPNSITIRWRTDIACSSKVQYGTSVAYGGVVSDGALTTEHIITISGLNPATKYYYTIGSATHTFQGDLKNNFITAPAVGTVMPVRVWAIGDFGNGTTHQLNVRNSYVNYAGSTPTNLWIWLGDDAYTKGLDTEFQDRVFAQYPEQFKSMPLFPTMGNHDYGDIGYLSAASQGNNFPYFNIFSLPQNGESGGVASNTPKYYSYNYANIHFISIDTYGCPNAAGSAIRTWLANDLAANTQRWTIVYMHHPPYTLGTHNSDTELELQNVRQNIAPLLESYKVDLVLAGHSHVNERSYLMKGHFGTSSTFTNAMKVSQQTNSFVKNAPYDGTVYAVCGTSGQDPEAVNQPNYPMPAMYFNNNTNNCSLVIDINGNVLSCKYLASTGVVVDDFTITKN